MEQPDSDMEQKGKGSKHLKRQNLQVKRIKKVNKAVGQHSLPGKTFAYNGYRSHYVSSLKLSGCGCQIVLLKGCER